MMLFRGILLVGALLLFASPAYSQTAVWMQCKDVGTLTPHSGVMSPSSGASNCAWADLSGLGDDPATDAIVVNGCGEYDTQYDANTLVVTATGAISIQILECGAGAVSNLRCNPAAGKTLTGASGFTAVYGASAYQLFVQGTGTIAAEKPEVTIMCKAN